MPFTKFPARVPRGSRRHWREQLTLPRMLALYVHGLVEHRLATYGFFLWDVGANRQVAAHGALAAEGPAATAELATLQALDDGLHWLLRHGLERRRLAVYIDERQVLAALKRGQEAEPAGTSSQVQQVRQTMAQFSGLTLRGITPGRNQPAIDLAAKAYVAIQEARRLERAAEVLPELRPLGEGLFLVANRYKVNLVEGTCTCPDYRAVHSERYPIRCKHLLAAARLEAEAPPGQSGDRD